MLLWALWVTLKKDEAYNLSLRREGRGDREQMRWFWDPTRCSPQWWLSSLSPILSIRWLSNYLIPCLNHHSLHSSENSSAFIWSYMCHSLILLATPSILDTLLLESVFFPLTLSVIFILGNFMIRVNKPSNILPEIKYIMKNHLLYLKCTVPINGLFFYKEYDIL